jgi:hypothetical protein
VTEIAETGLESSTGRGEAMSAWKLNWIEKHFEMFCSTCWNGRVVQRQEGSVMWRSEGRLFGRLRSRDKVGMVPAS